MQNKNIQSIYRLSPIQEGILYQCVKSPDAGYYHSQFSCRLDNLKDADKWQQVWLKVVEQHAVLRTFFTWEKRDQPLQIVRQRVQLPWQSLDWSNDSEQQIEQQWSGLKRRDKDLGFNLSKAPLIRFSLIKTGPESYHFLMSFHHILLDGWSQVLLFEQFINWLSVQDKPASESHWARYLQGFETATLLGTQSEQQETGSKTTFLDFSEDEVERLKLSAKQHKITLSNLFTGALSILIANETNQSDVVFGSTVSGRPVDLQGSNNTAGMFINTLPMRVSVQSDLNVLQWLKTLQSAQAANLRYSHSALSDIQRLVKLPQGQVLFDTILVVENIPTSQQSNLDDQTGNRLRVTQVNYHEYSHYPLAILVDLSDGIKLIARYQSEFVNSVKANNILQQLNSLLHNIVSSLDKRVETVLASSHQQTNTLPELLEATQLGDPNFSTIHQYIEYQSVLNPEKLALQACGSDGLKTLSYFELNQQANRIAHYLIGAGFAQHSAVAVLLDRDLNTIVSFLAILKTGAAYVPLDTTHPSERIDIILAELNNSVTIEKFAVLTDRPEAELTLPKSALININAIEQEVLSLSSNNPAIDIAHSALAYIIYTSGSTGKPKGVMVSHQNLIHSTLARTHYYPQQPDIFLMLSSLATDSSIAGIYWTLCSGNSLVISATRAEQDIVALGKLIQNTGVTHLLCIPSLYFVLLENIHVSQLSSLTTVIVAGESCSGKVIAQHQKKLPNAKLYNEYGPSEFTVWATASELNDWQEGEPIPIGKAIANTAIFVMNEKQQLAPRGSVGELYLAGENLTGGYLDDEIKTQGKFVPSPYSHIENQPAILYKTGDLVRYCDEKNLEFVGRADNQLKIRGNRLEPEEVENVLNSHPDILESVVFLQGSNVEFTTAQLASQLAELAPEVVQQLLEEIDL